MDKNNVKLLVYSLTPESGIKYRFKFILFLFVVFYFIQMNKNNVNLLVYSLTPESGIKIPV